MNFSKVFSIEDNYYTPKKVWEDIEQFIPKDKVILEAFYGNGKSVQFLRELGFNVIAENDDFFKLCNELKFDIIITNPPFSIKKRVLEQLKKLDKPFILLLPVSTLCSQFMQKLFKNELQVIVPKKRIGYIKFDKDGNDIVQKNNCNYESLYYCYKMNLERDLIFL